MGAQGEWPILLVAGCVGVSYPITPCHRDFDLHALPQDFDLPLPHTSGNQCVYYGMPLKAKYDTHIIPVAAPDYYAVPPSQADFHELVFDQDAQLLPLALAW